MEKQIIERFGGLLKKEPFSCVEKDILARDTCVLECVSVFSGYYDHTFGTPPLYLYLMLDGKPTFMHVARATEQVKEKVNFPFDAVFAEITFSETLSSFAIRIRDLEQYNQISELQRQYEAAGLTLRKKNKQIQQLPGLIRLEKFFYLEPWGEGFYLDRQQLHHGYFTIPHYLKWDQFVSLTKEAKFDTNLLYFDAALACFFENGKPINLIRIYKENLSKNELTAIRDRYMQLMNA